MGVRNGLSPLEPPVHPRPVTQQDHGSLTSTLHRIYIHRLYLLISSSPVLSSVRGTAQVKIKIIHLFKLKKMLQYFYHRYDCVHQLFVTHSVSYRETNKPQRNWEIKRERTVKVEWQVRKREAWIIQLVVWQDFISLLITLFIFPAHAALNFPPHPQVFYLVPDFH